MGYWFNLSSSKDLLALFTPEPVLTGLWPLIARGATKAPVQMKQGVRGISYNPVFNFRVDTWEPHKA